MRVTHPGDIRKRLEKFKRRAGGIRSEEHLKAVLQSFPEAVQLDVYNTVADLLGSDLPFPLDAPDAEALTVAEYIADLSKPVIKPSLPHAEEPAPDVLPDMSSDMPHAPLPDP